ADSVAKPFQPRQTAQNLYKYPLIPVARSDPQTQSLQILDRQEYYQECTPRLIHSGSYKLFGNIKGAGKGRQHTKVTSLGRGLSARGSKLALSDPLVMNEKGPRH